MRRSLLVVLLVLIATGSLEAQRTRARRIRARPTDPCVLGQCYYLDPDVSAGTHVGTQTNPWQTLNWTTINTQLATTDVIVYHSARAAGSDTDQASSTGIHLARTDTSAHVLTLDGMTTYNANDATPSWTAYPARTQSVTILNGDTITGLVSGGSRFYIQAANPIDTTQVKQSYVTIRGFHLKPSTNQALWYWNGAHVTVEYNELEGNAAASVGPSVYFVGMREEVATDGSSSTCTVHAYQNCDGFDYLTLRYNYIHETRGEGIYLGGIGDQVAPGVSAKDQHVDINHNLIVNPGYQNGEGDGIDIKTMISAGTGASKVSVMDNYIKFTVTGTGTPRSCLETLSGIDLERNFCDGGSVNVVGFSLTDFWSNGGISSNRDGSIIRNNIALNIGGIRAGIHLWCNNGAGDDYTNALIDNNTTYGGTNGINIGGDCTGTTLRNNNLSASSGVTLNAAASTLGTHSNNLCYKSAGNVVTYGASNYTTATVTSFEASALGSDPLLVSTSSPYVPANFSIQTSSPAKNAGVTIAAFATDYASATRPQGASWDIGAWEIP